MSSKTICFLTTSNTLNCCNNVVFLLFSGYHCMKKLVYNFRRNWYFWSNEYFQPFSFSGLISIPQVVSSSDERMKMKILKPHFLLNLTRQFFLTHTLFSLHCSFSYLVKFYPLCFFTWIKQQNRTLPPFFYQLFKNRKF